MLTQARADILGAFLEKNPDTAKELVNMEPEKAIEVINAAGHDFTVDELEEFGKAMMATAAKAGENGELSANDLESVAGGEAIICISLGVCAACGAAGFIGGIIANGGKWKW